MCFIEYTHGIASYDFVHGYIAVMFCAAKLRIYCETSLLSSGKSGEGALCHFFFG